MPKEKYVARYGDAMTGGREGDERNGGMSPRFILLFFINRLFGDTLSTHSKAVKYDTWQYHPTSSYSYFYCCCC